MVDPDELRERCLDHGSQILGAMVLSEIVRSGITATRVTSITTTEAAVLALLAIEGERSRYDLMKGVSKAIGYIWAPAKTQLYALLPRLAERGLATSRTVREGARPEKQLFRITDAGRAELDEWLASEPESTETFYLRLFVGSLVPPDVLVEHVQWFRERTEAQLAEYRAIEPTNSRTGDDFFHYFLLRLGIERSEHLLRWSAWVLDELEAA
jgi:DNA-binding PadR family transcriptional regulator